MPHFDRYFTVDEANSLLPELRDILQQVQAIRDRVMVDWEQARPVMRAAKQNGGGVEGNAYLTDMQSLNGRLRRLAEIGVQLKDLDRGLVDFPAWREDHEVFLCWHLGEDAVRFWHELDTGYSGRQAL
jgi:hypothetical protein